MRADWVAACVRARAMAQRRVGANCSGRIAAQADLGAGLRLLEGTVHAERLAGARTLAAAEHAVRATTLWQLRVLGGWIPLSGSSLARAAAAEYEADNLLALAATLTGGGPTPPLFELGALATAWPRARQAASLPDLAAALRTSAWGDVGTGALGDALTLSRLGRLAAQAQAARPWARGAAALLVARIVLVDGAAPSPQVRRLAGQLLGRAWEHAATLPELRAALPAPAHAALAGVDDAAGLWRAEARLRARQEAEGLHLLRGPLPGPDVVLGAITVLAVDAWRVTAALAAAAVGAGHSEVLDAVA